MLFSAGRNRMLEDFCRFQVSRTFAQVSAKNSQTKSQSAASQVLQGFKLLCSYVGCTKWSFRETMDVAVFLGSVKGGLLYQLLEFIRFQRCNRFHFLSPNAHFIGCSSELNSNRHYYLFNTSASS